LIGLLKDFFCETRIGAIIHLMKRILTHAIGLGLIGAICGCAGVPPQTETPPAAAAPAAATPAPPKPRIALALGGGAARGFAHIGVIKALEAQGIVPDVVVGTSAGSLVGALYAGGNTGFELQRLAMEMDEAAMSDWSLPGRGLMKGESLQNYVNRVLNNRPIEKLNKTFAAVATDLQDGAPIAFRSGNTGMAVRASSAVPGVFEPVAIGGREYVDGGLVSPVPVRVARSMGVDIVIAVDISARPKTAPVEGLFDILAQTVTIMSQSIARYETPLADVVIRPSAVVIGATDFREKNFAILEGERAAQAAIPAIRAKIAHFAAAWAAAEWQRTKP
jgi:NTE family protein